MNKERVVPMDVEKCKGLLVEADTEARIKQLIDNMPTKFGLPLLQLLGACKRVEVVLE